MRQTGILAGAAAYALTYNFPQLPRVHELARRLQDGLQEIGVGILSAAETCMVSSLKDVCVWLRTKLKWFEDFLRTNSGRSNV